MGNGKKVALAQLFMNIDLCKKNKNILNRKLYITLEYEPYTGLWWRICRLHETNPGPDSLAIQEVSGMRMAQPPPPCYKQFQLCQYTLHADCMTLFTFRSFWFTTHLLQRWFGKNHFKDM